MHRRGLDRLMTAEPAILFALWTAPGIAREISARIKNRFDGRVTHDPVQLYPALNGLIKEGFVHVTDGAGNEGRFFRLTEKGYEEVRRLQGMFVWEEKPSYVPHSELTEELEDKAQKRVLQFLSRSTLGSVFSESALELERRRELQSSRSKEAQNA